MIRVNLLEGREDRRPLWQRHPKSKAGGLLLARPWDNQCLVCGLDLPPRNAKTIQYFHGACRKERVTVRKF